MRNSEFRLLFPGRIRSFSEIQHRIPFQKMTAMDLRNTLDETIPNPGRGVYVHIPFCAKKCKFCGYNSCSHYDDDLMTNYAKALIRQIEQLSKFNWTQSFPFDAVYFGGGTPSRMKAEVLREVLSVLKNMLPLSKTCEISLESTLQEVKPKKFEILVKEGVNRVSLGVQSFQTGLRRKLDRKSDFSTIVKKISTLKNLGVDSISIDLLYNIPGQKISHWQKDLQTLTELDISGCSIYPLLPMPGSAMLNENFYKEPDPEQEFFFYKEADGFLNQQKDWERYSLVQYGKPEKDKAVYINHQVNNKDILALGVSAAGSVSGLNYLNTKNLDSYIRCADFSTFTDGSMVYRVAADYMKKLMLFRKGHMSVTQFKELFTDNLEVTKFLRKQELTRIVNDRLCLTEEGRFWSANLALLAV